MHVFLTKLKLNIFEKLKYSLLYWPYWNQVSYVPINVTQLCKKVNIFLMGPWLLLKITLDLRVKIVEFKLNTKFETEGNELFVLNNREK